MTPGATTSARRLLGHAIWYRSIWAMAAAYHMLDMAALPDELYSEKVPASKWFDRCQTAGADGFAPNSLNKVSPLALGPHLERVVNIPLYLTLNWLPFAMPLLAGSLFGWKGLLILIVVLGLGSYAQNFVNPSVKRQERGQYIFTERNNQKYLSMRVVWPAAFEKIRGSQHCIFAASERPTGFQHCILRERTRSRCLPVEAGSRAACERSAFAPPAASPARRRAAWHHVLPPLDETHRLALPLYDGARRAQDPIGGLCAAYDRLPAGERQGHVEGSREEGERRRRPGWHCRHVRPQTE